MKYALIVLTALVASIEARAPRHERSSRMIRREVPQEHSHNKFINTTDTFLKMNNPDNIEDAVFGLLGNAAAAAGQGSITNTDCLQQATADQAFSNAKVVGDVDGMTGALIYRALERNTAAVGQASVACTAIKAVNPEIAAISQHQDPASTNAAATNKAIVLELAKQIASVGGNPTDALQSGTFAPGKIGDPTAKGNTCDTADDPVGCIFSQNLLVDDATADEINAAVGGAASAIVSAPAVADTAAAAAVASTEATAAATIACGGAVAASSTVAAATTAVATSATSAVSADAPAATATSSSSTSTSSSTTASTSNLDFGSCSNPTIEFANGLDGRTEPAFEPVNEADFNHGSALKIGVITSFICQQLGSKCKASAAAITACDTGASAAAALTGQAAADAFNQALGF